MTGIVEQLRQTADITEWSATAQMLREAADRIVELETALAKAKRRADAAGLYRGGERS